MKHETMQFLLLEQDTDSLVNEAYAHDLDPTGHRDLWDMGQAYAQVSTVTVC